MNSAVHMSDVYDQQQKNKVPIYVGGYTGIDQSGKCTIKIDMNCIVCTAAEYKKYCNIKA